MKFYLFKWRLASFQQLNYFALRKGDNGIGTDWRIVVSYESFCESS